MNPLKLTNKQKEDFGHAIIGSRYVRDFCSECGESIRIPSGQLLEDNFCSKCDGHIPKGKRRYICDLTHLRDYDDIDIDSGFSSSLGSDITEKRNRNFGHFPDEI
jgi:hypothetical protein